MSDSDTKDSDEGIRYKTESVRKTSIGEHARISNKDKSRERLKRRYSQSSSTRRERYESLSKTKKRRSSSSSSSSSSTSSSDEQSESKYSNRDKKYSQDKSKTKTKIKSTNLKEGNQSNNEKVLGPSLPPYFVSSCRKESSVIEDNALRPHLPSISVGPELPPHMINNKSESIMGPSLTNVSKEDQSEGMNIQKPSLGPELPPHINIKSKVVIGPSLPGSGKDDPDDYNKDISKLQMDVEKPPCMESNLETIIGPSLPNLKKVDTNNDNKDTPKSLIGPEIPPCMNSNLETIIGPSFPNLKEEDPNNDNKEIPKSSFGPALPPHMINTNKTDTVKTFGPLLPPGLRKKLQEEIEEPFMESKVQGDNDDEEEEDTYGPLPVGMSNNSFTQKALEERALQLKINQLQPKSSSEPVRETWMIELPAVKASNLGLGPRQFRNRSGPDMSDRSSWTDLPGDKHKKKMEEVVDLKADAEIRELKKRDEEQEKLTKKLKRKEKSLLKMHADKLKSEKKDEGPSERRPFSRDVDLQVNRFDEAQKKAILKKAQLLDDRFSSGKSKFL